MNKPNLLDARAHDVTAVASAPRGASAQRWLIAAALVAAGAGVCTQVLAQPVPVDLVTGGQFTIGAGVAYVPRYEGADDSRFRALPLINYKNGRFFAGVLTGIGYNFSPAPAFEFGPVLSYHIGRDEDDADRLRGLGDIDGGFDLGVYGRWNVQPFFVTTSVKRGVSGDAKGTSVRLGAGVVVPLSDSDRLIFDTSADWADDTIMQAYYGVTAAQSVRSGLPQYSAGSGIRRYGVGVIWTHSYTPQWFSTVGAAAYRLGSDAGDSPIIERRTVPVVTLGVGYRFK